MNRFKMMAGAVILIATLAPFCYGGGDEGSTLSSTNTPASTEKHSIVLTRKQPASKIVVFMPEKINKDWFWYYYTEQQQCIVQSAIEKELVCSGYDLVDLTLVDAFKGDGDIESITTPAQALKKAAELNATYAIIGHASAVQTSTGDGANPVSGIRASAEAAAKIVRISDGKVLDIVDAGTPGGAHAQQAGALGALKELSVQFAPRLASAVSRIVDAE